MRKALIIFTLCLFIKRSNAQFVYPMGDQFPLVLYALYEEFNIASSNHWNGGHTYHFAPTPSAYFDTCALYGLTAMARLSYKDSLGSKWSKPLNLIKDEILSQSVHQNISWWDIPEELRYWYPNEMQILQDYSMLTRVHDSLKRPNFMYIPGHYDSSDIKNYLPYLDIIPASCYTRWQHQPHAYVRWSIEQAKGAIAKAGYPFGKNYLSNEKTVMAILEIFEGDSLLTGEGT